MSNITTRSGKGSALTHTELDDNFSNLNTDKLEDITGESIGDLSDVDLTNNTDGYVLTYNSTSGNIELAEAAAGGGSASTGDWSFSTNTIVKNQGEPGEYSYTTTNFDHTDGYAYSTDQPRPYQLGIGNGDFTTNDQAQSYFSVVTDQTAQSNGSRNYNATFLLNGTHTVANSNERFRALSATTYVNGSDNQLNRYPYTDNAIGWNQYNNVTGETNWLSGFGTFQRNNSGQINYFNNTAIRQFNSSDSPVERMSGITFEADNIGNGYIGNYYGIHNYPKGRYQGNGNDNRGGIGNNLRYNYNYYFIKNEDENGRVELGQLSNYHQTLYRNWGNPVSGSYQPQKWNDGNVAFLTVNGDLTISEPNGYNTTCQTTTVDNITLILRQDATGGHTVTLPTGSGYNDNTGTSYLYANGNNVVDTTPGSITVVTFLMLDPDETYNNRMYLVTVSPVFSEIAP